ncbi:hypothetical protein LZ626_09885 [Aeromonas allosaccharophila]|uniref:hypothetical protein n=1 Tax=Aeromonas allosaccharophila TaxID=656 RepID=UPI001F25E1B2|nr:hypothetical protein [Aeromonas allosaccharophila]MCE9848397.1 hypothetical protein [Aeromonas allosaccharophila]
MAPKKKVTPTGDDKSQQLAAAAVDQSAELVQAQAEPLQSVALEQAAEAQGVDLVAANQGDEQQLEEEVDISDAALVMAVEEHQPDWLLGQFDVKAKSPAGFWRCGIQFLHSSATRVFVVTAKADVPHDHSCEIPCCYLTAEEAKRVYGDQWLTVLIDSEVIKD